MAENQEKTKVTSLLKVFGLKKMNKIIACDVDLVLAQSDVLWWEWMSRMVGLETIPPIPAIAEYDLSKYFKSRMEVLNIDPMDFWRGDSLYTWCDTIAYSREVLYCLKQSGFKIIAASHIKGNTNKSKFQFLKRNYGELLDAYLATKEKHYVRCDYLIDDRISNLNKMPENVTCIRLDTPYTQDEEPTRDIAICKDWNEILKFILEKENIDV
jgi:5'(3')-deoxyribonucleotidase